MKNRRMQIWRIVFTYVITYYHLNNVYGNNMSWYIAVEFFFIMSGYLLTLKLSKMRTNGQLDRTPAWKYTFERYKAFFPHSLYSFFVAFFIIEFAHKAGVKDCLKDFVSHLPEVFLVQTVGMNYSSGFAFNSVTWYLSVLLIVGYFIWFFLRENKTSALYVELFCPLSLMIIYPYLYRTYGEIGEHRETLGLLLNSAMLRGFADMNLGVLGYMLAARIHPEGRVTKTVIRGVSDLSLLVGGILLPSRVYRTPYDFLFIFFLFVGIVTGFSCREDPAMPARVTQLIDKWAMITPAIYLNHKVFRSVFYVLFPQNSVWVYMIWFGFITVYSIFTTWFVKKTVLLIQKRLRLFQ